MPFWYQKKKTDIDPRFNHREASTKYYLDKSIQSGIFQ